MTGDGWRLNGGYGSGSGHWNARRVGGRNCVSRCLASRGLCSSVEAGWARVLIVGRPGASSTRGGCALASECDNGCVHAGWLKGWYFTE